MSFRMPWIDVVRRRRAADRARITDADVREALARELSMPETHEPITAGEVPGLVPACSVPGCGRQDRAQATTAGGIAITLVLCPRHTQSLAGSAAEKILRRFLGEQID